MRILFLIFALHLFGCDQRNNVSQITWQGPGITARASFTHDPLGDLTNIKRYADLAGNDLVGQTTLSYARNLPNIGYQAAAFNAGGDQTQTASFAQTEAFGSLQNDADTNGLLATGTQPLSRLAQGWDAERALGSLLHNSVNSVIPSQFPALPLCPAML